MDSLLLVLTVVGVVMVLIGVARMRGRRNQSWDDVDHSVLFDKEGQPEAGGKAEAVVVEDDHLSEAKIAEELDQLSSQINPRADSQANSPPASARTHPRRPQTEREAEQAPGKAPSRAAGSSGEQQPDRSPKGAAEARRTAASAPKLSFLDKIIGDKQSGEETPVEEGAYRQGAPEWVVVLNVMALDGEVFTGPGFFYALEDNGWSHGEMDIYHYRDNGVPLFSLVNMVKPGTFDPAAVDKFRSPGVSLFIQFPNDHGNGLRTFNMMLDMAQILADRLGGEVRDERRSVLTHSAIDHMREKIAAYDLKWQLPR